MRPEAAFSEISSQGPLSFLMKRKTAQKLAIQKALSDAFQKLLIVVLEIGKIAVEYRPSEDIIDVRCKEELHGLIQVCGDKNSGVNIANVTIIENKQHNLKDDLFHS
ncbi:hypothetical protein H8959_011408 [Pygathrix nigripes]